MFDESPLLKRGWVFQERLLSRRIIHYTKGKIIFECQTSKPRTECNEMETHDKVKAEERDQNTNEVKQLATLNQKVALVDFQENYRLRWYSLVGQILGSTTDIPRPR